MKRLLLFCSILCTAPSWANDIWFVSPQNGMPVSGKMTIQIQPPFVQTPVRVWIEQDPGDRLVWSGQLTPQGNYTTIVDVSRFPPGKYEVKAEYYINGKDFDGDVTVWVGGPAGPQGPGPDGGTYY